MQKVKLVNRDPPTDDRSLIIAVPDSWKQEGLLFWPPPELRAIEKLRLNLTTVPDKSWSIYKCEVKAQRIDTFQDAKKLETEDEEDYILDYRQKKRKKSEPKMSLAQLDFNEYVAQGNSSQNCTSAPSLNQTFVQKTPLGSLRLPTSQTAVTESSHHQKKNPEAPSVITTSLSIATNRTDMIFSPIQCPERYTVVASSSPITKNCPDMILSTNKCSMEPPERPAVVATSSSMAKNYPDTFLSSKNNQERASFVVSTDVTNYSDMIDFMSVQKII
ncbi:uncharacterized protein LOC129801007 [Phlebotomus papatasi]|uniref:uncharacterized protein LOC129801007 n=1 Tax=Phlebotomus papatasi TaxID=29031 RepID=UPI0024843E78|nr:uncharacterized protein LOC129801007 [Phlebotomus papatasi]